MKVSAYCFHCKSKSEVDTEAPSTEYYVDGMGVLMAFMTCSLCGFKVTKRFRKATAEDLVLYPRTTLAEKAFKKKKKEERRKRAMAVASPPTPPVPLSPQPTPQPMVELEVPNLPARPPVANGGMVELEAPKGASQPLVANAGTVTVEMPKPEPEKNDMCPRNLTKGDCVNCDNTDCSGYVDDEPVVDEDTLEMQAYYEEQLDTLKAEVLTYKAKCDALGAEVGKREKDDAQTTQDIRGLQDEHSKLHKEHKALQEANVLLQAAKDGLQIAVAEEKAKLKDVEQAVENSKKEVATAREREVAILRENAYLRQESEKLKAADFDNKTKAQEMDGRFKAKLTEVAEKYKAAVKDLKAVNDTFLFWEKAVCQNCKRYKSPVKTKDINNCYYNDKDNPCPAKLFVATMAKFRKD